MCMAFGAVGMAVIRKTLNIDEEPIRKKMKMTVEPAKKAKKEQEEEEEEEDHDDDEEGQPLLPGLPDHIAEQILGRVPSAHLLFSVCRRWRRHLYSAAHPSFLSLYAVLSGPAAEPVELQSYDPLACSWAALPSHPLLSRLVLSHPGFLSRSLPVQTVAAAGRLVLLAATAPPLVPALPSPLVFHPGSSTWQLAPPLRAPRRWCAAGTAGGRVYAVSGVGGEYCAEVARSVERWDPGSSQWERMAPLRDGRFSREAVEAVACAGKLCVVNVQGRAAKDGAVYDVGADRWEPMPKGMVSGWTGPAAGNGGGSIYVADEAEGALRAYDWARDRWVPVVRSELLREPVHVACAGRKVCVAAAGGRLVVVVDVAARPAKIFTVEPPPGRTVVALHVLPRPGRARSHGV